MVKRLFDLFFSIIGLILLFPLFIIISIWIKFDSKGPVFYKQNRVGKNFIDFKLIKFRTMKINSDKAGLLTIGKDSRITRLGFLLRRYKLDELPQLFNVFEGKMSLVGPRPEVRKFVELYNKEQRCILSIKPGITDFASLKFRNENDILAKSDLPEQFYIKEIMPVKLNINLNYIRNNNIFIDIKIIILTLFKILKK